MIVFAQGVLCRGPRSHRSLFTRRRPREPTSPLTYLHQAMSWLNLPLLASLLRGDALMSTLLGPTNPATKGCENQNFRCQTAQTHEKSVMESMAGQALSLVLQYCSSLRRVTPSFPDQELSNSQILHQKPFVHSNSPSRLDWYAKHVHPR